MEFHISRSARDFYQFDEPLYALNGNVVFANFHAVRLFTQKINQKKDLVQYPETAVQAGQINAMGLIDEILHYVIALYREQTETDVFEAALQHLNSRLSPQIVDETLFLFTDLFPPLAVYRDEQSIDEYLNDTTAGRTNREVVLEEMLMLWLANMNPAFQRYDFLFNDDDLTKRTAYQPILKQLNEFFQSCPVFGPDHQPLIDMLRSPAIAVPHSLTGQLEYIRKHWGILLQDFLYRLLSSIDMIKEEERGQFTGTGPGPARVYDYSGMQTDVEAFSQDLDWMPRVVIMAKNAYVWLDQLAKKYDSEIRRLDQIPDEELDRLAQWGFTGLWLIGLWERSKASKQIKQWCGNPDAEASAYSLLDYGIADDLGGNDAFQNLKTRAWQRGIRMAGDMVPNHVGIDGKWVVEHPDWFIGLDYCPYPSYTFSGENLCHNPGVGVYLEDHYYSRSDAAVVFKRVDLNTGETRYIYHGNDGTSMPWNDTAQLDYLNPEMREAVIQTILHVARNFPIIRFDAAMTLAKKHIQRLWYPEPGAGGAIPSRAEHAISAEEFNRRIPKEFWREVVDRVAREAPDTLLLAEAFWMLEGYFVRTLGMHRVYNSAFMNMLKNEENAKYRTVIKDTLSFDPEILKRFVNFMNNPDEDTAVAQFGKEDKYFGVCVLLATMPGLPMFGHGQIEGFSEKYGMEFRRAYWDETPDPWLIEGHEQKIFPLLQKRYLFSGVENFLFYDLFTQSGHVDENVFVYSNAAGGDRALVVVHNVYAETRGWIRNSVGYMEKGTGLVQKNLGQGLALSRDENRYVIFRDQISGLEFIRQGRQLCDEGLFVALGAYQAHVFVDFREVDDASDQGYGMLMRYLDGRGVPSIDNALTEIVLGPIHTAFNALIEPEAMTAWLKRNALEKENEAKEAFMNKFQSDLEAFVQAAGDHAGWGIGKDALIEHIQQSMSDVIQMIHWKESDSKLKLSKLFKKRVDAFINIDANKMLLFAWSLTRYLGLLQSVEYGSQFSRTWLDEWLLARLFAKSLRDSGASEDDVNRSQALLKIMVNHQYLWESQEAPQNASNILNILMNDMEVQQFLNVNRYQNVLWYNQEQYAVLLGALTTLALIAAQFSDQEKLAGHLAIAEILEQAGGKSEYQVEKLMEIVKEKHSRN